MSGKNEQMAREIAARVIAGDHPGILVAVSKESGDAMVERVKEILRAYGFGPQRGDYEPVSGPKAPIVVSGPIEGQDESRHSLRFLNELDRL